MAESQVLEWSTEYLPYRDMKKMLKELVVTVGAEERAAANERAARGEDRADAEPVPGLASPFKVRTRASGRATLTDERGSRKRGELITVRRLHTGSSTDESVPLRGGAVDDASDVAPLRVSRGDPNKVGNPADNVISTSILEPSSAGGDRVLALEHERRFFFALDDHLRRVVAFYGDRLSRARREAMNERVQLRHLRREAVRALDDLRAGEARELRRETALDRFLSSGDTSGRVSTSGDSLAALRDRVAKTARSARLLRRAVSESYRGMNMLESYVSLNMEAFRKIVKKHDKLTGWQTQETYMKGLKELRVFHDDEVGELRAGMESAYLKIEEVLCALEPDRWKQRLASGGGAASSAAAPGFYEVRKRRNQVLSKLREDGRMEPRTTLPRLGTAGPAFASGLALGAAIALGAMFTTRVVEACATPTSTACAAVAAMAPAMRAPLLLAAHVCMYGGLVRAWAETRVNAPFVFQSRRGTELTAVGAVLAGALATCAWFSVGMILAQRAVESAAAGAVGEEIIGEGSATGAGRTTIADLRERALGESFLAALAALAVAAVLFIAPWGALVRQPQKAPPRGALRAAARRARASLANLLVRTQHPPESTRRFFLRHLARGLAAPAYRVVMMDFFLMDQAVSHACALRDVTSTVFLAMGPAFRPAVKHAPLIALVPSYLRLAQCARRFRDDGQGVHLWNAGKYLAGMAAIALGLAAWYGESSYEAEEARRYRVGGAVDVSGEYGGTSATRHAYNVATYVATIYALAWDLFMDWSVMAFGMERETPLPNPSGNSARGCAGGRCAPLARARAWLGRKTGFHGVTFLSRRLMLHSRWKYFAAIALNVALRNTWIIASVPVAGSPAEVVGAEAWITLYAFLEVVRRSVWSYFRVENEHATNCGMFRATLDVPLPFQDGELTDDELDGETPKHNEGSGRRGDGSRNAGSTKDAVRRGDTFDPRVGADGPVEVPGVPNAADVELEDVRIIGGVDHHDSDDDSDDERARRIPFDEHDSDDQGEGVSGSGAHTPSHAVSRRTSITIDIPLTPSRRKSIDPEDDDSKGGGSRGGGGGVDSQRSVALEAIAKLLESAATEKEARDEEEQKMMERGE